MIPITTHFGKRTRSSIYFHENRWYNEYYVNNKLVKTEWVNDSELAEHLAENFVLMDRSPDLKLVKGKENV